jgi:hypothetical protein
MLDSNFLFLLTSEIGVAYQPGGSATLSDSLINTAQCTLDVSEILMIY